MRGNTCGIFSGAVATVTNHCERMLRKAKYPSGSLVREREGPQKGDDRTGTPLEMVTRSAYNLQVI